MLGGFFLLECPLNEISLHKSLHHNYIATICIIMSMKGILILLQLQLRDWNLMLGVASLIAIDLTIIITYTLVERLRENFVAERRINHRSTEGVSFIMDLAFARYNSKGGLELFCVPLKLWDSVSPFIEECDE